jgi:hypothetical protein
MILDILFITVALLLSARSKVPVIGAIPPKVGDFEYDRSLIDSTLMLYQIETPTDTAFIDLTLIIPTFLEKRLCALGQPRLCQAEKIVQRSQCACGNHLRRFDFLPHRFNAR